MDNVKILSGNFYTILNDLTVYEKIFKQLFIRLDAIRIS